MSCNGETTNVVLPDGGSHSGALHETGTITSELSAVVGNEPVNGEPLEEDEDGEDGEDARFFQELRERRNLDSMALQVVVEVCTEVHDTT